MFCLSVGGFRSRIWILKENTTGYEVWEPLRFIVVKHARGLCKYRGSRLKYTTGKKKKKNVFYDNYYYVRTSHK